MKPSKNDLALARAVTTGSRSQPELLTEAHLIRRGITYHTQAELGFSRPDFLILNHTTNSWLALHIDGAYPHRDRHGHDLGKDQMLIGYQVAGKPITQTVRLSDTDLYANPEYALDRALAGEQLRPFA